MAEKHSFGVAVFTFVEAFGVRDADEGSTTTTTRFLHDFYFNNKMTDKYTSAAWRSAGFLFSSAFR